jgi:type IV pilus assembly protein PilW
MSRNDPMRRAGAAGRVQRGVSLIELMVAMTIGLIMIAGAVTVFSKTREVYSSMEATARLQETARYAMSVIESDVRMANYWGLISRPDLFTNNATSSAPFNPSVSNNCGADSTYVTDTGTYLTGTNNAYSLTCGAYGSGAVTGSDVLISRRVSATRIAQSAAGVSKYQNYLLVESSRTAAEIFKGDASGTIPAAYAQSDTSGEPPRADTRQLMVNAYYLSNDSSVATGFPSLRRKTLIKGPAIQDDEIAPGVEDFQVQIGVDTTGDRNADVFVNPGSVPAGGTVVAARIWLRIRAQDRDVAWKDTKGYVYADRNQAAINDQYRRIVYVKTIQLRNTRS